MRDNVRGWWRVTVANAASSETLYFVFARADDGAHTPLRLARAAGAKEKGRRPRAGRQKTRPLGVALSFAKDAEGGVQRCAQPAAVRAATVS